MKTFYDITTIDTKNQLKIQVVLKEHNNPLYLFTVNKIPVITQATICLDLLESVNFYCEVQNGAIEIEKIIINDKLILPLYLHLACPKTSWITKNWCFEIVGPFYPWYHSISGQGWTA